MAKSNAYVPNRENNFPDTGVMQKKHSPALHHKIFLMCEFQSLFFDDDGYLVRCKKCSFFQVAFISTMLTLTEYDFNVLHKMVKYKCNETADSLPGTGKSIILETPSQGIFILLTRAEAGRFCEILEQADNEFKAITLINLFNP